MDLVNLVVFCVVEAGRQLCWFWDFLGGTSEGQCKMLLVTSSGLPVRSYKVIHSWQLPVLAWMPVGRATLQTEASDTRTRPGASQQKAQGTLTSATACWLHRRLSHQKAEDSWVRQDLRESPG